MSRNPVVAAAVVLALLLVGGGAARCPGFDGMSGFGAKAGGFGPGTGFAAPSSDAAAVPSSAAAPGAARRSAREGGYAEGFKPSLLNTEAERVVVQTGLSPCRHGALGELELALEAEPAVPEAGGAAQPADGSVVPLGPLRWLHSPDLVVRACTSERREVRVAVGRKNARDREDLTREIDGPTDDGRVGAVPAYPEVVRE